MRSISLLLFALTLLYADTPLDLFEEGKALSTQAFRYSAFTDAEGGGASTIVPSGLSGRSKASAPISYSYSLAKDKYQWSPFAELQLATTGDQTYDASGYKALSYHYKGDAHTLILKSETVQDWAYHEYSLSSAEQWRTVTIALPQDLYQPNWGLPTPLDLTTVQGIGWRITGEDGDSGSLAIKEVTLLDSFVVEQKNDLILRNESIPPREILPPFSGTRTPLQAKAQKYLNKGVSLHNWLEENALFSNFRYTKEDIIRFKKQGFLGIRFPIDLDLYVLDKAAVIAGEKALKVNPLLWTPLDSLVAWTAQLNLSLTIDYHQYDASLTNTTVFDKGYRAMAAGIWKRVAARYHDNERADLFYELTNEPGISGEVSRRGWRELSEQMIDSIRSVDTTHTLIWGDSRWYEIENLVKNSPFEEENIIYSFHYYEPFLFTHQGASWTNMGSTRNTPFPYTKEEWHTEYSYFGLQEGTPNWVKGQYQDYYRMGNANAMYNQVLVAKRWALEHNVALINNEFGAHPRVAQNKHLVNYFTTICGIFEELNIPWQVWFGTVDEEGELIEGMKEALKL